MNTNDERCSVATLIGLLEQTVRINPERADQFQAIAAILRASLPPLADSTRQRIADGLRLNGHVTQDDLPWLLNYLGTRDPK